MKRMILALGLSLALVAPALAGSHGNNDYGNKIHKDININVDVYKTKVDKDIDIDVNKTVVDKKIDVDVKVKKVKVDVDVDKSVRDVCVEYCINQVAQAEACKFDSNSCNTVYSSGNHNLDTIWSAFNECFTGIAQVNQSSGSINNQGNVVAAAVVDGCNASLQASANVQMENYDNCFNSGALQVAYNSNGHDGHDNYIQGDVFVDTIDNAFNGGFTGLAQVNQSAGFMNNQNNVVSLAAGKDGGIVACADASLAMCSSGNRAYVSNACTTNSITCSFNGGFKGLAQVNQSAGSMNNQANVVSIASGVH